VIVFVQTRAVVMDRNRLVLAGIWVLGGLYLSSTDRMLAEEISPTVKAANPHILPQGQAVLRYIASVGVETQRGIVSGQWVSPPASWPDAYKLFVESLAKTTGKSVALLGSDYFGPANATAEQNRQLDEILIGQWKAGGLVTLTWDADNPWYEGHVGVYCHNAPKPCVPGNLMDLTRPDTAAGARFKLEMDSLAEDLERLQAAGVIVLFRPFHEMNGSWFWWGARAENSPTQAEFAQLWKYTYKYLTEDKKLNNLLWVFSPNNSETQLTLYPSWHGIVQAAPYYYPGAGYVDITGVDLYDDRLTQPDNKPKQSDHSIPTYSQMVAFGKPFGLAEFGPGNPQGKVFDFDAMAHELARDYPKVTFFMAWQDDPAAHKYFSIINNPAPQSLMDDPLIITRDKVHY